MVRNKDKNFPKGGNVEDPRAKPEFASKRPNGQINTRPKERMKESGEHV